LRAPCLAGIALAASVAMAAAQEMKPPHISHAQVDWNAVTAELQTTEAFGPVFDDGDGVPIPPVADPLGVLNRAVANRIPNIGASAVPVLLPFDIDAFLRDREHPGSTPANASANYLSGFESLPFFQAGPGGYDAVVTARAADLKDLGIGYSDRIFIHIAGAGMVYELGEPKRMTVWPVNAEIEAQFPGIKRVFLENYARYSFVRHGVTYVVAIECFDGPSRYHKIACKEADKVAIRVLKSLKLVGGSPQEDPEAPAAGTIDRPTAVSTVFTYYPPGAFMRSGAKVKTGVIDYTVYSKIRFPMADAPAFANTQFARSEGSPQNYLYPWHDNFCEPRAFFVGQCGSGLGHQGQDIRPAYCRQRSPGARCEPYQHDVVAARDGMVMRAPGQQAVYVVANAANERIRVRYLHMSPKQLDADGMVSGRVVHEGEVIGKVGNFWYREGATTYHLHFDLQVLSKYGWVFVSPYMTLVAAYERLIKSRGVELREDTPVPTPAPAAARPAAETPVPVAAKPTEKAVELPAPNRTETGIRRDERTDQTSPVKAGVPADHGGSHGDGLDAAAEGTGEPAVRPMGRRFSRPGARTWHFRRDLHAGDEQPQAGHGGL
jgi:murein DD-endopeptidase MepM/ murein hydrolase activator NlpD